MPNPYSGIEEAYFSFYCVCGILVGQDRRIELPLPRVRPERPKSPGAFATRRVMSTLNISICVYCWPRSHDLESTSNPKHVPLRIPIRGTRFLIARRKVPHVPFCTAVHSIIA